MFKEKALCVVCYSQHKSAGSTLHATVTTEFPVSFFSNATSPDPVALNCGDHSFSVAQGYCPKFTSVSTLQPRVLFNGLALTLASFPAWTPKRCTYITLFREPISRILSVKLYCSGEHFNKDPLCGSRNSAWFQSSSPLAVAEHWGNYQLRDLLMHPLLGPLKERANTTIQASRGMLAKHSKPPKKLHASQHPSAPQGSIWEGWRRTLNGGDDPTTDSGARNLKAVCAFLPGALTSSAFSKDGMTPWPSSTARCL